MKKLHKTLTLALALIMILGVMAMPASAVRYDDMYVVWTEDEFWDLDNPRPVPPEKTNICMFVVTKGDTFDWAKFGENPEAYRGEIFDIYTTCDFDHEITIKAPDVQAAAKEAYDRITDAEYKTIIAGYFGLSTGSDSTSNGTSTEPEKPTEPETPVTTPITTTTPTTSTTPVTGFSDVKPGDWYYEAVMALANSGILAGYGDGRFGPNQTITVGELATILCRVHGIDLSKPTVRSSIKHGAHDDLTIYPGHWAENAMRNMEFHMCMANMEVNRGWAIGAIAVKLTQATWSDGRKLLRLSIDEAKPILDTIPDIASDYITGLVRSNAYTEDISHYPTYRLEQLPDMPDAKTAEEVIARDYILGNGTYYSGGDLKAWNPTNIATAYSIGLVNGVDKTGRCDPWAPVTRAQIVQMLYNMGITYAGQLKPLDLSNSINANFVVGGGSNR